MDLGSTPLLLVSAQDLLIDKGCWGFRQTTRLLTKTWPEVTLPEQGVENDWTGPEKTAMCER